MEIIKRGIPQSQRKWVGRCHSCGSEAIALQEELNHITHDQRDGSFSWEKCPVYGVGNDTGYGGMIFYPINSAL